MCIQMMSTDHTSERPCLTTPAWLLLSTSACLSRHRLDMGCALTGNLLGAIKYLTQLVAAQDAILDSPTIEVG